MTYSDRFLKVASQLDLTSIFKGIGPVSYFFDPDEWLIIVRFPEMVRVIFRARPNEPKEDLLDDHQIQARLRRLVGTNSDFIVKDQGLYHVHQRIASTFRIGRILLLGDAAHVNNPLAVWV